MCAPPKPQRDENMGPVRQKDRLSKGGCRHGRRGRASQTDLLSNPSCTTQQARDTFLNLTKPSSSTGKVARRDFQDRVPTSPASTAGSILPLSSPLSGP